MKNLNDKQKFILGMAKKGVLRPLSKVGVSNLIMECFRASVDEDFGGYAENLKCDGLTVVDYDAITGYIKYYLAKRGDLYVSKIRENILRQEFFVSSADSYNLATGKSMSDLLDQVLWFLCESGEANMVGSVVSLTIKNGNLNADSQ